MVTDPVAGARARPGPATGCPSMSTFSLKRFSEPSALKAIAPAELLRLLQPNSTYFRDRGVTLPVPDADVEIDYAGLVQVLMSPGADTPEDLSNALYFIHEMATPEDMEELLAECERRGLELDLPEKPTAADVAVRAWLRDRKLVERKHAEKQLIRVRAFEHFRAQSRPGPKYTTPPEATFTAIEDDLKPWFGKHKRGKSAKIFVIPRHDSVCFLVRHGLPYERRGVLDGEESSSVFFQGETYDVIEYAEPAGELRVHAKLKGEKELYRKKFGRHLFGHEETFLPTRKYTLEPLRALGRKALECADIDGMKKVWLKRVDFFWGTDQKEVESRKAQDVFAAFERRKKKFPKKIPIVGAVFGVEFTGSATPRTVSVRVPRGTQYSRDGDRDVVERWLWERGFIVRDR